MTDVMARRIDRHLRPVVAGRVTAGDPGRHLLDLIDAREQALAGEAGQAQAAMDELAVRLREVQQEISDLQVTRKTLLSLAAHDEGQPAAEPAAPLRRCPSTPPTSRPCVPLVAAHGSCKPRGRAGWLCRVLPADASAKLAVAGGVYQAGSGIVR